MCNLITCNFAELSYLGAFLWILCDFPHIESIIFLSNLAFS